MFLDLVDYSVPYRGVVVVGCVLGVAVLSRSCGLLKTRSGSCGCVLGVGVVSDCLLVFFTILVISMMI